MTYLFIAFFSVLGPLLTKVLKALGIGSALYLGVDIFMNRLNQEIVSRIGDLPPEIIQTLGILNIDVCINIMISTAILKFTMKGFINA